MHERVRARPLLSHPRQVEITEKLISAGGTVPVSLFGCLNAILALCSQSFNDSHNSSTVAGQLHSLLHVHTL